MRVKAYFKKPGGFGYCGGKRRRHGDEFTLSDPSHFSEKWMVKLDEDKPRRGRPPAEPKAEGGAE